MSDEGTMYLVITLTNRKIARKVQNKEKRQRRKRKQRREGEGANEREREGEGANETEREEEDVETILQLTGFVNHICRHFLLDLSGVSSPRVVQWEKQPLDTISRSV